MNEKIPANKETRDGIDVHPHHDSWVRITTHNSFVSFAMFLALAVLFYVMVSLHFGPVVLGLVGVMAALTIVWFGWRSKLLQRGGLFANAGMCARIRADLMTELGANAIDVESSKGVVTLRGSVPYANFRASAEVLARRQGAHLVINELTVSSSPSRQPDPYLDGLHAVTTPEGAPEVATHLSLEERVRQALDNDPRVHVHVLIVHVADGIAYLTGRQETVQASDAATEVAIHVPGILGVSNDIEILTSV